MAVLSRRDEEKILRRKEILNAAKDIFDDKGFIKATIEDIAFKSRLSVGTIYNFFNSKESLYESILKKIFNEYISEIENEALSEKDFLVGIKKIIEIRFKHFVKYKGFFRTFFESALQGAFAKNASLKKSFFNFKQTYIEKLVLFFQKNDKFLKNIDPVYLALSLEGTLHFVINYEEIKKKKKSIEESIENIYLIFQNLIGK